MTIATSATPEQPTSGEIMRAIGRVEKTLDQWGVKIDRLDDKLDGHAGDITRHEVRLTAVEKAQDADAARRSSLGVQIKAALLAGTLGIAGSVTSAVIAILHH